MLLPTNVVDTDDMEGHILPENISIARVEDLLEQMRIREVPKRAQFSVPFQLAEGFTIGVKGCAPIPLLTPSDTAQTARTGTG